MFKNWNWTFPALRYFTLTLRFVSYILARIVAQKYFATKTLKILLLLLKIEVITLNILSTCYFVLLIDNLSAK